MFDGGHLNAGAAYEKTSGSDNFPLQAQRVLFSKALNDRKPAKIREVFTGSQIAHLGAQRLKLGASCHFLALAHSREVTRDA